jgi:hypothetical protein
MATSDGKGAGGALIESMGDPRALMVAAAIAIPGIVLTVVLTIWAIASS